MKFVERNEHVHRAGDAAADAEPSSPATLEGIAVHVAREAATIVALNHGTATSIGTKSSPTDVVTQTDIDSEGLLRRLLGELSPDCGIIGEEGGATQMGKRLQWIIDPLDGTVNFLYGLPVCSVSVAAAVDGRIVAGAVVDALRGETFSAWLGGGARVDGAPISMSACMELRSALIATGFSYTPRLREGQGRIVHRLLPEVRDIRCFGSAALNLCWAASGRIDAYFERDIKIWDWAAGSIIASEAGLEIDLPCPENDSLVLVTPKALADELRALTFFT